jgi:hypothetical protein
VTFTLANQPMGSIFTAPASPSMVISIADGDAEPLLSFSLLRGVPGSGSMATVVATAPAGGTALSYTDLALAAGNSAYYYAIIVQADGDRIVTSPIWYTRGTGTATAAAQPSMPVDVFPNPAGAGQAVTVSYYLPAPALVQAEVLDALGRPVMSLTATQRQAMGSQALRIPTNQLAPGLYTVRLVCEGGAVFRKLVVSR